MSPDPDDLVARIASFKTPEACEQFAKNVEARGKPELAQLARRRAIEIRAEEHGATTTAERDALEAVYAYERTLFLKHGRVVHASRTWQMIKKRGVIQAVENVVTRTEESSGYVAFPRFGGRLNKSVIVAVGPVGAVGNAKRFPSGCGNRASDFRRCGSFHGPGGEPVQAAFSWRFAS